MDAVLNPVVASVMGDVWRIGLTVAVGAIVLAFWYVVITRFGSF